MAVYSTNQVRHLYIVNDVKSSLDALENPGDIFVNKTLAGELFFDYKGALGDVMATDLIKTKGITYATATSSDDMAHKIKGYKIALEEHVNGGQPVAGQDYILRADIMEYKGMSGYNEGQKYGMVHARIDMSASDLYKLLAINFAMNNDKEPVPFLKVCVCSGSDETEVTGKTKFSELTGDVDSIVIYEKEGIWRRGLMAQETVNYSMTALPIIVDGDRWQPFTYEKVVSDDTFPQGQLICDLEWFAMGERGDQYRGMGYPNFIPTKYLADPDCLYDVVNIHYHYADVGVNNEFSEKDIQLACLNDGSHTVANALIGAINTAAGTEIETL